MKFRFVLTVVTLAGILPAIAVTVVPAQPSVSGAVSQSPFVAMVDGHVRVDVDDGELVDILSELAARADFRLATVGQLGRVTAAFTVGSIEQALRRLVQDHELMLLYSAADTDGAGSRLVQVEVFASPPSPVSLRGIPARAQRAVALAEISTLARSPNDQRGVPRLMALLASAPDPTVRARAAWALGRTAGASGGQALARALTDQAPEVRIQALYALRESEGPRAIPALARLLLGDADVGVRRAAARTLATLPESEATSALSVAAEDSDRLVRREVTGALRRRGVSPPP